MGLETYHVRSLCTIKNKHCQVIRFALHVKIAAMCQSCKVKESILIQQKSSLVLLNGILMLETKGQSKQ